jgi:hypothetical protein
VLLDWPSAAQPGAVLVLEKVPIFVEKHDRSGIQHLTITRSNLIAVFTS